MYGQILPADGIDDSMELLLAEHRSGAGAIYRVLLSAFAALVVALPLLRVQLSVRAEGLVRPTTEKHEVAAPTGGVVERVAAARGEAVRAGDTLVVLGDGGARARAAALRGLIQRRRAEVADLALLARDAEAVPPSSLHGAPAAQAVAQLAAELAATERRHLEAQGRLDRAVALHRRDLLSRAELEAAEAEVDAVRSEAELLRERARARWQADLAATRDELERLGMEARQAAEEVARSVVLAPVSGTLEELASVSPGSFVAAGTALGVISPEAGLVAEVWIAPRDVALVRMDAPVRIEVQAFDYRDWGFAGGRVIDLSRDYLIVRGEPYFRARLALDRSVLRLQSGAVGEIRKGMTVSARFPVARRSLWQLLRDRADDWLAPSRAPARGPVAGGE